MKKRIFSFLLALCMAFALLPAPALAAKPAVISTIRLTIDAPSVGSRPASTAKPSANANSTVEKVEWSGTLNADGTFKAGTKYTVTITMGIKKDSNRVFSDKSINATVNGKKADEVFWYADDMVQVIYTFPTLAMTAINTIRLTIDAPSVGSRPAATAKPSANAHSTVEKVEWSGLLDTDGTFMPRVSYTVTITMGIQKGSNRIFSDKAINATVNDKEADDVFWYAEDKVTVVYTFPQLGTGDILTMAHITLEEPSVGAKPAATAKLPSTASTYIKRLEWIGPLDGNGCFQAGTEYTAMITLAVKDGLNRRFSKTTFDATVNGVVLDAGTLTRVSDKELIVPVMFQRLPGSASAAAKVLDEVYLTIDAPAAGGIPAVTASVPSDADYYVKSVTWTGALNGGKFNGGVEYTAVITLGIKSGSGAKFSDTFFDASVNGVIIDAATLTRVSDTELIVPAAFEKTPAGAAEAIPSTGTAYASTQMVEIDGKKVEFQMYALRDGRGVTNYVKVRDLALALNGTAAQFSVDWNGAVNLTRGAVYVPNGSENKTPFTGNRSYTVPTAPTNVNGAVSDLVSIYLVDDAGGGYTYYQLRDLGRKLGFSVDWSAERGVFVETGKPYTGK